MKCLTYQQVRKMWEDANWEQSFRWSVGDFKESIRYCKIANRLYNCMMSFPTGNVMMGEKGNG